MGSGSNVERVFVGYLLRRSTPGAQAEQTRGGQLSLKWRPLEGIREPAPATRDFGTGTGAGRKGSERPDSRVWVSPWEEGPAPAEGRVSGARIWVRWVRGPDAEAGPAAKAAG